jgi:hypothetical protein
MVMHLVTFSDQGQTRLGVRVVRAGRRYVIDLHAAQPDLPDEMIAFFKAGEPALRLAQQALDTAPDHALRHEEHSLARAGATARQDHLSGA